MREFKDLLTGETYTGFNYRFPGADGCEWIAIGLVVGNIVVFHLDGPVAIAELHRYLGNVEDGASLIGLYRRLPGTQAPFHHDPAWKPKATWEPASDDLLPTNGSDADIAGHESLKREAANRVTLHQSDGYMLDITSDTTVRVHSMTKDECEQYERDWCLAHGIKPMEDEDDDE